MYEISRDELYPYYEFCKPSGEMTPEFFAYYPITDEFIERYRKVCDEFFECQALLQDWYNKSKTKQ